MQRAAVRSVNTRARRLARAATKANPNQLRLIRRELKLRLRTLAGER